MGSDVVILQDLTPYGLFRLHVQNVEGVVDRQFWLGNVSAAAARRGKRIDWDHAGICAFSDFQEVHNLWIVWKEVADG
jgi:hypothetical protein